MNNDSQYPISEELNTQLVATLKSLKEVDSQDTSVAQLVS